MRPQSAKAKGRRLQQRIAADIVAAFHLHPDDATSRSSGATGSDVLMSPAARSKFPFSIEAKNVESVNVWKSWEQAQANGRKEGHPALLVLARNNTEPLAVLKWDQLLALYRSLTPEAKP